LPRFDLRNQKSGAEIIERARPQKLLEELVPLRDAARCAKTS
jgi:hypothetical protein